MTTETILTILGIVVGSNALFGFIQFLISRNDGKKEAMKQLQDAVGKLQATMDANNADMALQNEALMAIAQDRILYLCKCYIKQGWVYDDDISSIRRMANAYRDLGGNDVVKTEMDILDAKINNGSIRIEIKGGMGT